MTKTPNRSSLSRRVLQAASSFKAMLFRSLFRSSIYESIRPVLSGRMGWLQTLSSLIGRGSEDIHKGGVLRVSAKERAKRSAAREFRRRFVMAEQLELRALMAADLGLDPTMSQQPIAAEVGALVPGQVSQPVGSSNEVVFVDPGVTDPQSLMQGLRAGVEFVMLDGSKDGVAQIAAYLEGKSGIQAIHLVGHGRAGEIYLGTSVLGNGTLDGYVAELSSIGRALTDDGDILVYGCETAQGTQGQQFLQQLARLTSADVAGSSDITGGANLGGDWDLEERVGIVQSLIFADSVSLNAYTGVLVPSVSLANFPTSVTGSSLAIPGGSIAVSSWATSGSGTPTTVRIQSFVNDSATASGTFSSSGTQGATISATTAAGQLTYSSSSSSRGTAQADMNAALSGRSMSYTLPANTTKIRFLVTATDNTGSGTAEITLNVGAAPTVVIGNASNPNFTEDGSAVSVAPNGTVSDTDSSNLTSMTITLLSSSQGLPPDGASESLTYTAVGGVTGSYVSGTGVLALTGSTTKENYQSILQSVRYSNSSQNPTTTNRLVRVVASDGTNSSTAVTATVTVAAVNDAPTVSAPATFTVTEDVASNLLYTGTPFADVDTTNLTVTLSVADGTIAGATVAGITLGGTATARTFAGTVSALNTYFTTAGNITYTTAANNNTARTLTTSVSDGTLSASTTSTINITAVNDAPTVSAPASFTVTEDVASNLVYTGTPFADVDSANLTVTLSIADGTISGAVATGITIGGSATARTFTGAISDLNTYFTTAGNITYTTALNSTAQRTLTTSVSDGALSASANSTINVTAVNDAPTISLSGTLSYTENAGATVINSTNLAVADVDSANLSGATVSVEGFVAGDGDILGFTNTLKIFGTYTNGVLTLTGTATPGEYQAALRSVTYRSTSDTPPATRRLLWQVTDAPTPGASSAVATSTISITAVNDAPVVYLGGGTTLNVLRQFTEGTPVSIAPSAVIGDVDSTQLQSLTITLTNAQNGGDEVLTVTGDTTGFSVTGNGTATVTITGNQSLSAYSTLLQSVTYNNTSSNPTTSPVRTITVVARDNAGGSSANSAASTASVALSSVNNAPVYSTGIENKQLTAGLPFSFSFPSNSFTDAENDPLTYTAQVAGGSLPAWLTFNASTRKFYGVPPTLPTGGLTVTVTAKDPSGGSATKDFTITTVATLNGNAIASVGFVTAYNLINPATHSNSGFYQEETNSFTTASSPFQGTNFVFFQDGVTTFSGNNVPGKLMYINGSGDVVTVPSAGIGSVSRPIKTPGNVVKGYYMWNNAGTSGSVSDDTATLLVVDPNYFTGSTIYNSSSDQVDAALNGYLTAVTFDIAPASADEGTASPGSINFIVTRSTSAGIATVQYSTSISGIDNASANDFVAASGTYTFPSNSLTGTISIATRNDEVFEPNETFTLTLSNPLVDNGQIAQGRLINSQATGTIVNDDTAVFTIAPSGAEEGTPPGAGNAMTFTVTRVGSSAVSQTVSYATALRGTGEGFASADDFGSTSGSLIFAPGETTKTFTVTTVPDDIVENDEVFDVILSNPTNGATVSPTTGSAVGTIEDDESNAIYSIANSGNTEGSTVTFTITRSRLVDIPQTISFFTTIETGDTATSGTDFTAVTSGVQTITFGVSELTRTVTVSTIQDTIYEGNETFTVVLNALQVLANRSTKISSFNGKATGTILDDETAPVFSVTAIDGPTVESVDSVGQTIRFRVSRNVVSQADQTIDYATFVGTAGEDDYIPVAGTLTFPSTGSNSLSQTVTVTLKNDAIVESTENFTLQISNPTGGATLGTSSATGTILDSNKPPVAGGTITTLEDTPYVIQPGNIYTDPEGSGLAAIDITTLPNSEMGFLQRATTRDANGVPLESGWVDITTTGELQISGVSGIGIDGLRFNPAPNKFTTTTPVTFNLRVNDGAVWSTAAGTVTINITPVNDEPAGADKNVDVFVGGEYLFTETDFGFTDPIDNDSFLNVIFTDVPQQADARGTVQVRLSGPTNGGVGSLANAQEIVASAFNLALTGQSFTTADPINPPVDGFDKVQQGRYGQLFLNSTNGAFKFEQYTDNGVAVYIESYAVVGSTKTPVFKPLNLASGVSAFDGFVFRITDSTAADPISQFRRTLSIRLTSDGHGSFAVSHAIWRSINDNESVAIQKVMAGEVRYSPCFCGIPRYKLDGTTQVTVPTAGQPGFGAPYFSVKFQVQDDGGTQNGGVDTDQTPNKIDFSLINNFTPTINIPLEQVIDEETVLRFGSVGQSNALYLVYAPPVPVGQSVDQVRATVRLSEDSRPGSLSLEGSNYTAAVTPVVVSSRTVGYVIEGLVANVNAVLADLVFTPDANLFSTYDKEPLDEDWGTRYPPVNGIGGTHTFAALTVVAENIPSPDSIQYPPSKRSMDILVVNVNDAPVVIGESPSLIVDEDVTNSAGVLISTLVGANFSDATDAAPAGSEYITNQALAGIAITSYTPASVGNWQYSANGTVWTNLGSVSSTSTARSLPASYRLRFVPVANYNGAIPSLTTYLIEDSSTPVTAGVLNVSDRGGTTRFTADPLTILGSVTAVNDAPIATGASTLPAIVEDTTNPAGDTVSSLFSARFNDSADQAGDTSANTLAGIAITSYTRASSKGDWQYSSDSGTTWTTISSSISGNASAMTFLSTDRLRFLPKTDFNGPAPSLTVRLLETPRSITTGATVDVSTNGGATTISSGTVVLSHSVTPQNDAPVASGSATLTAINEDTTNPPGATVSSLFSGNFSDAKDQVIGGTNANIFLGVAVQVHTQDAARGYWEYTSGADWTAPTPLPTVSGNNAILLRSTDRIRFVPALNYNGPATPFVVRLLDNSNDTITAQTAGSIVVTSPNGGTTVISEGLVTLTHTVNPVNDPPTSTNNTITILEDEVRPLTNADFGNYSDVENQPFSGIRIVTAPSKGTLQYNIDGVWTNITTGDFSISDASIKFRYIPAPNENGSNYTTIEYCVSDGVDCSVSTYTLTINVTPVNDPPISTDDSVTFNEDAIYYFNVSDFGTYSDIENNPLAKVQITSLPSLGTLEYKDGTSWVSALNAEITPNLLTGSSATSSLRYTPPANSFGSPFTGFGFKVSDGTDYSLSSYTVTINIAPVNDAPVASGSASLASVFKNDTSPPWATVSSLFSGNFSDPLDTGNTTDSFYGVAISGLTQDASKGTWEYKIGSTIDVVPNSSDATAFVLSAADSLRFVPANNYVGNATVLSVRLIETKSSDEANATGASDASGSTANVSTNGGTTVYSAATVNLNHEVKGTLLVKAFNDVSEGSDAIFRVSLDSNSNIGGTSVTLGLTDGTASSSTDYGPGYDEAYYYDGSNNKQTLSISGNVLTLPQNVTVFYVSVPTTNDTPKVYEGPETFSLSASITVDSNLISNSDVATIRDDGNGKVFNEDGTVNNSATPDNDLSVTVTGYGPVNEGSTYAMFKVDAASGDGLNFSVINGTATLVTPTIEFSLDGTTWTVFNASDNNGFPTVPAGAGNIGTVYVRVTITSESDSMYEGSESFSLRATSRANSSVTATASTDILDNGTGLKYTGNFTGDPMDPATDDTNLDNDLSVQVTSYSPVNEGSTWAMFKVVAAAGDVLNLDVTDISTTLRPTPSPNVPPMWFSYDGSNWTLYGPSSRPTVPGGSGTGTVYVRVDITAEQETALDTGEVFTLTAMSNGPGNKSGSANTTILDNGSGTVFNGLFGNDLPQISNVYRDDDRLLAVADKVLNSIPATVTLSDVRVNDTIGSLTISELIGLNPTSSTVSSTVTTGQGTWTVLSGGRVQFVPAAGQKTDPTPLSYAISPDGGANYSRNTAKLYVDYGAVTQADSVDNVALDAPSVNLDVLPNDNLGDTVDSGYLKILNPATNALVDSLVVSGQGTWSVVDLNSGTPSARKGLQFVPLRDEVTGRKSFAGDPTPVRYVARDVVEVSPDLNGLDRGGNQTVATLASIRYRQDAVQPTFFIRIDDWTSTATRGWNVIVVDNLEAGQSVTIQVGVDAQGAAITLPMTTTHKDMDNTVGIIYYEGALPSYSVVKVDARSKPVTTGSVADIRISSTTQSTRAASIEIQAADQGFVSAGSASSPVNSNRLSSPLSGNQAGTSVRFRETLGLSNQGLPGASESTAAVGSRINNDRAITNRSISSGFQSGAFTTTGQQVSLMKSLLTINTGASQITSLTAGGKIINDEMSLRERLASLEWVTAPELYGVGVSRAGAQFSLVPMTTPSTQSLSGSQKRDTVDIKPVNKAVSSSDFPGIATTDVEQTELIRNLGQMEKTRINKTIRLNKNTDRSLIDRSEEDQPELDL